MKITIIRENKKVFFNTKNSFFLFSWVKITKNSKKTGKNAENSKKNLITAEYKIYLYRKIVKNKVNAL